ncbi:MAG: PGPGW domain-containing protein [Nanoarchaeota archaeon]|nr:PGPGW domain-containing protein [Nanoarchaeota archaeon]
MENWLKNINQIKKFIILVMGMTVLVIGMLLLFLPGPGMLIILLGIVIIAIEFVWARRLLKKINKRSGKIKSSLRLKFK